MKLADGSHLSYCTNIHAGETWPEVLANLRRHLPRVRALVAPDQPFGIGLRLSAAAAQTLAEPARLDELQRFLAENRFYVFTLNGFPYGAFHGVRVKERVYEPDWRDPARLSYTNLLADILAELLPPEGDPAGSVSTVPGAFKAALSGPADVERMRAQLVRHAAHLVDVERRTGRAIALAIEPEPCCFIETVEEAAAFFGEQLFGEASTRQLSALTGLDAERAGAALRAHLGLCLDLCHAAVEFEEPAACIGRLADAGIAIAKLQISAGLRITDFTPGSIDELRRFVDPVYLHQVVERGEAGLRRFTDLPAALDSLGEPRRRDEWRVHFHVPIFHDAIGAFRSTRRFIETVLGQHRRHPLSRHLEVETYTWDVLPPTLRDLPVEQAIARELVWARGVLAA